MESRAASAYAQAVSIAYASEPCRCRISRICACETCRKLRSASTVRIASRSAPVPRSSAWITASVALPSRRSLR